MARKRVVRLLVSVQLAAAALFAVSTDAQAATSWRVIHSQEEGSCLTQATEPYPRVSALVEWCGGDFDQQWSIDPVGSGYRIRNRLTNACVSTTDKPGTGPVELHACGFPGDVWDVVFEGYGSGGWYQELRDRVKGKCLGDSFLSTLPAAAYESPCGGDGAPDAQWNLGENLPVPGGLTVPNVLGWDETGAVGAVRAAGLVVDTSNRPDDCVSPGDVEAQSPPAGVISPGAVVHLTISTCTGGGGRDIPK